MAAIEFCSGITLEQVRKLQDVWESLISALTSYAPRFRLVAYLRTYQKISFSRDQLAPSDA